MRYAEVSVNSPIAQRQLFSYSIPDNLNVQIGQAVRVPFGNKTLQGIVLQLSPCPAVEETREIYSVIEERPLLSPQHVALARWISDYYLAPVFDAVGLMLPPGFERKPLTFLSATQHDENHDRGNLTEDQRLILENIRRQPETSLKDIENNFGQKKTARIVPQLVRKGLVSRRYELEPVKIRPLKTFFLKLSVSVEEALREAERIKRATRQSALLRFLAQQPMPISWADTRAAVNCDKSTVNNLVNKGFITMEEVTMVREPITCGNISPSLPLKLTTAQKAALESIKESLANNKTDTYLLHGVTGSGKTEVYLQALAEAVKQGKRGIVLVPEIALTPQIIERFTARFSKRVAVLHSRLSPGEQYDEWHRIRNGEFDVVIGPRSALFAPQPELGIIIIDEEHEWTYKQHGASPRYHARDAALKLAELTGVTVVMGSATPDVETYYYASTGKYKLLELPERVTPAEGSPLPEVKVVDLREELKAGNRSIFSHALHGALQETLDNSEQAILFLNRRGGATFIQCRACGHVVRCRRCEIPLTYHPDEGTLVCHQCNNKKPIPTTCPQCASNRIKFLGLGTQKLAQETAAAFPSARLLRWDSDSARHKNSDGEILNNLREHQTDILIGTQVVAKGLDVPLITMVGVVNADTSLNLPDFRAGEKTFQLLCQVAGRAGRGINGGRVIVQTFSPEHYAIRTAAKHDYTSFYEQEISYRRQLHNPPFSQLAALTCTHTNDIACQREAERIRQLLLTEINRKGIDYINLIGPAPAFIHRLRGKFRWQMILRGRELSSFLSSFSFPQGWSIDIDPASLL